MANDNYDPFKSDPLWAKSEQQLNGQNPSDNSKGYDLGWADGIGEGQSSIDLLDRADVQADMRAFYKERDGDDISDPEELKEKFYSDRTWRNMNTVSMARDARGVLTMSDDQAVRLAKIQKLYDALPNFYEKGGRGAGGLAQNVVAGVVDPVNLVGGIFGKAAGGTAMKVAARAALKEATEKVITKEMRGQIVRRGVVAGIKSGAKVQAAEGVATGAVQDALIQSRNTDLGLQDGYDIGQGIINTGANAIIGGGFGAVSGAGGALYGGKVSRALRKARTKTFGDFTTKYTDPDLVAEPAGVAQTVDAEAATAGVPPVEKNDAKVSKYVAAQREQYQRNLDATIDEIRNESGEAGLAEWRAGTIKDKDKTAAMKQADTMQSGRTALSELYNWPNTKAALERDLEKLSNLEAPKAEQLTRMNELNDRIARGDDAYESINRAAGSGKEDQFDKAVADYVASTAAKAAPEEQTPAGQAAAVAEVQAAAYKPSTKEAETGKYEHAFEPADLPTMTQEDLGGELTDISMAKAAGLSVDKKFEKQLRARYKELTGQDHTVKAPDVGDTNVVDIAQPTDEPQYNTTAEANEAYATTGKEYNNLNNKIMRLRKAVDSGKATPDQTAKLTELTGQRDKLIATRKQIKERAEALSIQEAEAAPEPVIRTIEAEAADSPLDVEGAATFLADYGFPAKLIKKEMADYIKAKSGGSQNIRAKVARQYVAEKIAYARSVAHLEQMMDKNTESVAYIPSVMRKLIESDPTVPDGMRQATLSRYNEWLDFNAQSLFSKYLAENDTLELEDILSLVRQNHGEDMERLILAQLSDAGDNDILQHMAIKSGEPKGWDKLTAPQQASINAKIADAKVRLMSKLGATGVSEKKVRGQLAMVKQVMVQQQLYLDFGASIRTSGQSLGDAYPVIIDPDTKGTVSGKVFSQKIGDFETNTAVDTRDKFGLQAMFKKATGGRASSIDEYGDLVIDHPYFGSLLVRDIQRAPDGSIDFAKTTDGKYITKTMPNGKVQYIPRRFDAAESARRAQEQATIASKTNRVTKVKEDVANLKVGDSVTQKQLAAAQVEAARLNPNRRDLNKRSTGADVDESAEAINKKLRESVKKTVVADAVRNAMATAPESPERALAENLVDVEATLKEEVTLPEREAAWSAVESENRAASVEAVRSQRIIDARDAWLIHQDNDQFIADLNKIQAELAPATTKPKAHTDKPAGAKAEPRMYVYAGYEVDVRNHFAFEKTSETTSAVSFLGEKVGDLKTNSDGTATLLFTDSNGLENSIKASSLDKMADHLPSIFGNKVKAAGTAGKLIKSFDEISDSTYPIDWKSSNTWGKQTRTVPIETVVEEPAKLVGPAADFKKNLDVSAINVDIPEGHVLAVHILEGDFEGVTRVESTKAKTPQTIGQMLGSQKTKGYTVGYVPAGTQSASRDATRLFQPLDAQDPVARAGSPKAYTAKGKNPKADVDDLGRVQLASLGKIDIDQNDLPIQFRDKGLTTLAKVHDLITNLENVEWAEIPTQAQYATFVKDMADLYETRAKYAPKGIKLPTASRVQSMNQWKALIGKSDGITLSTGLDLLRRLSFNDRDLPIIQGKEIPNSAGGYALPIAGSDNANRLFLNPNGLNPDGTGDIIPKPVALLHEMAHWAYMNILTDADRLQFWGGLGKYFEAGEVDMSQVKARLPGLNTDEASSPAEFFANQFSQWAITQGKVNNIPLWTKMAKALVEIARAFGVSIRGERASIREDFVDLDPDMVELFTRILPDTDPMYGRYVGLHQTLEDVRQLKSTNLAKAASVAANTLVKMDLLRKQLDDAIQSSNPESLELALDAVSADIRGMVAGERGAVRHRSRNDAGNTGGKRLRIFDSDHAGSAKARATLLKARKNWKDEQLLARTHGGNQGGALELSTKDIETDGASGDLGSSFDAMSNFAYSTQDETFTAKLTEHAIAMTNALATAQDEARAMIGRIGKIEGKNIRVSKDGTFQTYEPSAFKKTMRYKAARRAATQDAALNAESMSILADAEAGRAIVTDREALGQTTLADMAAHRNVADMDVGQLNLEYKSLAGVRNARKKELENEIKARISTMPEVSLKVPAAKYEDIPLRALEKDLFSAIKRGKFEDFDEIANAMAWKKRGGLDSGIITASSPKVRKAVKIIQANNAMPSTDNGVPTKAPLQIRETIKAISHRSRTDENHARTVSSRLFAMMGKGENALAADGFITRNDLSKLMGFGEMGDDAPVNETDEIFTKFREQMRAIGKDMRTDQGRITAAQTVSKMAVNALTDPDELAKLGTNQDELAAAFFASMSKKNSIDNIFDELPESSRARIADLFKENMEATSAVMTGLLSPANKRDLQPMTLYGNMLGVPVETRPYHSVSSSSALRGVHPFIAENFRKEWVANTNPTRRASIENFTAKPLEESLLWLNSPSLEMLQAKGQLKATKSTTNFGDGVYLARRTADDMTVDDLPDDLKWTGSRVQELRDRVAAAQANLEGMRANGADADDYAASVLRPAINELRHAISTDANLWRMAKTADDATQLPHAIPFVARATNSFDASNDVSYTFGTETANSLDWLLSSLEADGHIKTADADSLRQSAQYQIARSGSQAYGDLAAAIARTINDDQSGARNTLNQKLRDLGYDSIDDGAGLHIFDADNVRHVEDASLTMDDFVQDMLQGENTSVAGKYLEALSEGNLDEKDTAGLMTELQRMGMPAILGEVQKRIFQKKPVSVEDVAKIGTFTKLFGENAIRIRKSGAHWLADKIKPAAGTGFYEELDTAAAKSLIVSKDDRGRPISILTKLRRLPGNPSVGKRWVERNKFWGKVPQPEAYDAIVLALRMGDQAEAAIAQLPKPHREAAQDIQKFFRQQLVGARNDGLPIGFKRNYFPQVWDADVIKQNPERFDKMMASFYLNEMKRGEIPMPSTRAPDLVAMEKAKMLRRTLTDEGSDGVLLPDNALRQRMENPFFERTLNFEPSMMPQANEFLMQDLEGIIAKYADQITRRRVLTKRFGLGSHAATTYLNILADGKNAIVDALRNTKNHTIERRAQDATMDTRVSEITEVISAIPGTDEDVTAMVDKAMDILGSTPAEWRKNKETVRNYFMNLQDPDIVASQPEYAKRVDAIVNALAEFGGQAGAVAPQELRAMTDTVCGAMKKPRDIPNPSMMKFSRGMRTFNSVSLLAFTTLASIPDIGMPMIRSGNMKAAYQGWKKHLTDPHYREMARNVGVGLESIMHERMAHMYNDTASRTSNAFFNMTFLNSWTNVQREASALIGFESFKAEAKRAQDLLARGQGDTRGYMTSLRYLQRYGLEKYAMKGAPSLENPNEMLTNDALREGMMRFVNESIFAPNPNDIPLWAQGPIGAMVFQLKSYPLMMGRLSKYVMQEAFKWKDGQYVGNPAPFMALIASAGALGSTSLALRDVVQQRGEDGGLDTRDRFGSNGKMTGAAIRWYNDAARSLGLEGIESQGTTDAIIGWFAESFMVAGGFGLFADLLHQTAEQSDNQDYGKLRVMSAVAGPTFSKASTAVTVAQAAMGQAFDEKPDSRTARSALRETAGYVPVLGGIRPFREGVASLAGAPKSKKKKKNKIL